MLGSSADCPAACGRPCNCLWACAGACDSVCDCVTASCGFTATAAVTDGVDRLGAGAITSGIWEVASKPITAAAAMACRLREAASAAWAAPDE